MRILLLIFLLLITLSSYAQKYITLQEKGDKLLAEGKTGEAIEHYAAAIADMKKENANSNKEYTALLKKLAELYTEKGKTKEALALYMESVSNSEKIAGKNSRQYLEASYFLADFLRANEEYALAETVYEEMIRIATEKYGKENMMYVDILNGAGLNYYATQQFVKANEAFQTAIQTSEKLNKTQTKNFVKILNNQGLLYQEADNFELAERNFKKGLEICKSLGIEKSLLYATCLNNLGVLYTDYGFNNEAANYLLDGLLITKEIYGTYIHPQHLLPFMNVAGTLQDLKEYKMAEDYYQLAFEVSKKYYNEESLVYITLLDHYATYQIINDRMDEAEKSLMKIIELRKKIQGVNSKDYAMSLSNLGNIYMINGDYLKAEPLYQEALKIVENVYGKQNSNYSMIGSNLAENYSFQNKNAEAEKYFLQFVNYLLKQYAVILPSLSEKEKKLFIEFDKSSKKGCVDFMLSYAQEKPAIIADLYDYTIATKGLIFQSGQKMRQSILQSGDQELIGLYDKWKEKNDYLVRVWQTPKEDLAKSAVDPYEVEKEVASREKELAKKAQALQINSVNERFTWKDIQKKLKPTEAVVEILRVEKVAKTSAKKMIDMNTDTVYAIMIVTPKTQLNPTLIYLENGAYAETKGIKYYRNCIKFKTEDELSYNTFWKPIVKELNKEGIKKVFVSNDGVYHQLNLLTLQNPETKKYACDEMEIQLVCNSNDVVTYQSNATAVRKQVKDYQIYLFGYPNYSGTTTEQKTDTKERSLEIAGIPVDTNQRFLTRNGKVNVLPGTKKEVEFIHSFAKTKNVKSTTFIAESANEETLKKLNNPDILHIATHGFFLTNISQEKTTERGFSGMESTTVLKNPLLRSGLLLAHCEPSLTGNPSTDTSSKEDGILTAQEAISLNLSKTEIVVLSACETGLGQINNGEGVYGLQRSFQQAGAKTILMSLWTVSDMATQEMMSKFYTYLLSGQKKREAFLSAQKDLRVKYPSPYFWGAFVMVGE
jgi:CHAT domain-containing protein/tetratricopeptide (TPR) repeat protein